MVASNRVESLFWKAEKALDSERYEVAANLLRRLVASDPDEPLFRWRLGNALEGLDDPKEAIVQYKAAIDVDPDNVPAWGCLGSAYLDLKKWKSAESAFRRRLLLKKSPQHFVFLAVALRQQGRFAESAEACFRAIALDPTYAEGYLNLGLALRDMKSYRVSLLAFLMAIENDPSQQMAFREAGFLRFASGRPAAAKELLERSAELDPNDAWSRLYSAIVLEHLGESTEAAEQYRKALELDPANDFFRKQQEEFESSQKNASRRIEELLRSDALSKRFMQAAIRLSDESAFTRKELADFANADARAAGHWIRDVLQRDRSGGLTFLRKVPGNRYEVPSAARSRIKRLLEN